MKMLSISTLALSIVSLTTAAPLDRRTACVNVEFQAAANTGFNRCIPLDGSLTQLNDARKLSISHIKVDGSASCTFHGSDGGVTKVTSGLVDVGPPQAQLYGSCVPVTQPPPSREVTVQFQGATPEATYTQSFPVNGEKFTINDPKHLSVSHIAILGDGHGDCTFFGVDGSATEIVAGTVDVGPPQAIISGVCGTPAAKRTRSVTVHFEGATPEASYTQTFPVDGSYQPITKDLNHLSISHVSVEPGSFGPCTLYGVDGSRTFIVGGNVDVGPPQAIKYAVCDDSK